MPSPLTSATQDELQKQLYQMPTMPLCTKCRHARVAVERLCHLDPNAKLPPAVSTSSASPHCLPCPLARPRSRQHPLLFQASRACHISENGRCNCQYAYRQASHPQSTHIQSTASNAEGVAGHRPFEVVRICAYIHKVRSARTV